MSENEIEDVRARALHKLRTRGLSACIDALIDVAEDRKAPANARATAGSSLARANGLFAASPSETGKELHEMTLDELKALSAQVERDRQRVLREMEQEETAFD